MKERERTAVKGTEAGIIGMRKREKGRQEIAGYYEALLRFLRLLPPKIIPAKWCGIA